MEDTNSRGLYREENVKALALIISIDEKYSKYYERVCSKGCINMNKLAKK